MLLARWRKYLVTRWRGVEIDDDGDCRWGKGGTRSTCTVPIVFGVGHHGTM